jgi:hypothetical protein
METSFYSITQAGFIVLTVIYITLFVREIRKALAFSGWERDRKKRFNARLMTAIILWAAFVSAWSFSGKMSDFTLFPFNFMPVILIPAIAAMLFISSKGLGEIIQLVPPARIIRLQSFRLFVEVLLWLLFIQNLLPVQMTFEGRNFDILAGVSAPLIAMLASRGRISKTAIVVWNVIGLCLLLNIVVIAILSTPSPWRLFTNEPANFIVTYFPISWLPGVLVPLAYYLHFISLRQTLQPESRISDAAKQDSLPIQK